MGPRVLFNSLLCLAISLPLSQAYPAEGAPQHAAAAPQRAAAPPPHMAAAPHVAAAAPHMAAPPPRIAVAPPRMMAQPHIAAARPHISLPPRVAAAAPHMPQNSPHLSPAPQHFSAPPHQMATAAQHFSAPAQHMSAPQHMSAAQAAQHMSAPQHVSAAPSHTSSQRQFSNTTQHMNAGAQHGMPEHIGGSARPGVGTQHNASASSPSLNREQNISRASAETTGQRGSQVHPGMTEQPGHHAVQPSQHAMSPITSSSPANLQAEHQEAMSQLRQEHPTAHSMPGSRFNSRQIAGAAGGLALTGLAAHQIAAQRPGEQHEPSKSNFVGSAHEQQPGDRTAAVPGGRAPNPRASSEGAGNRAGQRGHEIAPGTRGASGTFGAKNVPPRAANANPREFSRSATAAPFHNNGPAGLLAYRHSAHLTPQPGDRHKGVPGIFDPGGYVRTPQRAGTVIDRQFAARQLASIPNYTRDMDLNNRNIVRNQSSWPWQLPQQPVWWNPFGWGQQQNSQYQYQENQLAYNPAAYPYNYGGIQPGYGLPYDDAQYDPYDGINPYAGYPYAMDGSNAYWNGWNNYGAWNSWNSDYSNSEPFYGTASGGLLGILGGLFGGGGGQATTTSAPNNWLENLLYFTAYSQGGNSYPVNYFAMNGYAPTPYVFNVGSGQFWQPGVGYGDYLPDNYQAPITVALQEVVPTFDANQNVTGYQPQTFYYDAYWDPNAQAYGYYDYRSKFHWVSFPSQANNFGRQVL